MPHRTFIVSDIHGDARHFRILFNRLHIDLREDFLYVNGDTLDRGRDSLQLFYELLELRERYPCHLQMIKGNHELFAQYYLQGLLSDSLWSRFGGADTLREIRELSLQEREKLIRTLDLLPLYRILESPVYGEIVLTHSGLLHNHVVRTIDAKIDVLCSIEKAAKEELYNFLISSDIHYMPTRQLDQTMIVGHVPNIFLEKASYHVLRKKNLICIDSGAGYRTQGGKLCIYNLEEDEAYYD